MGIDQWASNFRMLSPEASAEPGIYKINRAEYQRGIMQAISDNNVKEVVLMCSSQVGKTEILLNCIGYHIHYEPAPMLVVQPTVDMAKSFSKERLANMIRDCPVLKGKVKDARSRDSDNTVLHKKFPLGHITICGANSPAGLASRPIRVVLLDEVDRYPLSAGAEGDPTSLAQKRMKTFWNRKTVMVSTPTIKGLSRIEAAFLGSDQSYYYVGCKDCGYKQRLLWKQVEFHDNDPKTAKYKCENCQSRWNDADRWNAIRDNGEWRSTKESEIKGFHLSELYSSWSTLSEIVKNFLESKDDPTRLKTWVNTSMGESWEDEGVGIDDIPFMSRRENYYPDNLPKGIVLLTAGVDVQDDRIEVEVVGWGKDEECWSVDYKIFYGDLSTMRIWDDLNAYLESDFLRTDGLELHIVTAAIDSGGHYTQAVYNFCRGKSKRRIWAIKGQGGQGVAIWPKRASVRNIGKVPLYTIGVDSAKDIIFARLKIEKPGAGYCHFPMHDEQYFEQLTAEKVVISYKKGVPVRSYKKVKKRNEALDCRVYAYACYLSLLVDIEKLAQKQEVFLEKNKKKKKPKPEELKALEKTEIQEQSLSPNQEEYEKIDESDKNNLLKEQEKAITKSRNSRPPRQSYINSWR